MTILPTLIQSVAHPPRRDGKQPGPIEASPAEAQAAPHSTWRDVLDAYEADVKTLPLGHEMPTRGCSTYNWKMSVLKEIRQRFEVAAPFPHPHAKSSQSCGNSAMSAVTRVPPLSIPPEASAFEVEQRFREASIDPAFLAAWRETQGQPVDAEAR